MKTILVVDDDLQLRGMLTTALKRKGYRVIEAESGVAALDLARQHLPDLILTDIHMPGGDGSTLLREIRHDPALRSRQVVLMTGRPDLVTPRRGMEEGADDFLVKPVDLQALVKCMEARFIRDSINWRVEDRMLEQIRSSVPPNLPHEFFTPLAGIIGLMDVLRSDPSTLAPAEIADIYHDIHQSALRLNHTLRNYLLILDLQGAAPVAPAVPEPLPPDEVRESIDAGVAEVLRLNARKENISVKVEDCSIAIKPDDLSRAVEELADNACKFSRQGTPIKVEMSAKGRLTVTDQGKGLTAEEISRIGIFQQFDRKKHEQQGLGLGLILVQKLAALAGADFHIESRPGEGTEVRIDFPTAAGTK
jgi:two-component system sensor histidine kinase/response regulator